MVSEKSFIALGCVTELKMIQFASNIWANIERGVAMLLLRSVAC
jgi:hypothetical protein